MESRLEIIGIPWVCHIPAKQHPYPSIIAEAAAESTDIGRIHRDDKICGLELPIGDAMSPVRGKRNAMPPHHAPGRRIDVISLFLRGDCSGINGIIRIKSRITHKREKDELSHRRSAYIPMADEYDPHKGKISSKQAERQAKKKQHPFTRVLGKYK